jgi:NitT/TauT family transport system permease protein
MKANAVLRSPLTVVLLLAFLWELAVQVLGISPRYLPALSLVLGDAWLVRGPLVVSFGKTLLETVCGFSAGALFGLVWGAVLSQFKIVERSVFPLFVLSQTVPVIAFGAIVVIWFGNALPAKVVIALYLTFFPVVVNTLRGLRACDPQRFNLLQSFGATPWQSFFKLALPGALPVVLVGVRVGISQSFAGAIVGEWFGDNAGLGAMILEAMYYEHIARLWGLIIVCGVMGALLIGVITVVERRIVWWGAE